MCVCNQLIKVSFYEKCPFRHWLDIFLINRYPSLLHTILPHLISHRPLSATAALPLLVLRWLVLF